MLNQRRVLAGAIVDALTTEQQLHIEIKVASAEMISDIYSGQRGLHT